jgi:hypothetical protein
MKVVLVTYLNSKPTARHQRAEDQRMKLCQEHEVVILRMTEPPEGRSSKNMGDRRNLPYLKDLLRVGLDFCQENNPSPSDVIVWTNDDVMIDPRLIPYCRSVVRMIGATSMRRIEPGDDPKNPHMGRELFCFTKKWLDDNLDTIPDFIIGGPFFDLVMAALIRKQRGIESTVENMKEDIYPCDCEHRYAFHDPHPSSWAGAEEHTLPANLHNRTLARKWCSENMPSLKL